MVIANVTLYFKITLQSISQSWSHNQMTYNYNNYYNYNYNEIKPVL